MKHDYKVYKDNNSDLTDDIERMYAPGFLEVEKDYPQQRSSLPFKKEKDCELVLQQKGYNKNHFQKRIAIEHAIYMIIKYRIMSDIFRNRIRKYDRKLDMVSGLVNYMIMDSV